MKNNIKNLSLIAVALIATITASAQSFPKSEVEAIKVNKAAVADRNNPGQYTITLDSFVEGEIRPGEVTPLDVILVLDYSGSMGDRMEASYNYNNYSTYTTNSTNIQSGAIGNKGVYITYNGVRRRVNIAKNNNNNYGHVESVIIDGEVVPISSLNLTTPLQLQQRNQKINNSDGTKRIEALKAATKSFIEGIKNNRNTTGADHRVSVVRFSGTSASQNDNKLVILGDSAQNPNNSNGNTRIEKWDSFWTTNISNQNTGTWTPADKGLETAFNTFSDITYQRNSKKIVVFFTDGEPCTGANDSKPWFDPKEANEAIVQANKLRGLGVDVYAVNVYPDSDAEMIKYVNYISSNYPNAENMSYNATDGKEKLVHGYSFFSTDATKLNEIFNEILGQATGGAGITLPTTTIVKDIMSESFVLPEGANENSITIKTQACTGVDANGVRLFASQAVTASSTIKPVISDDRKTVSVSGFNFSDEWCGLDKTKAAGQQAHGKKLIISFNVEVDPTSEGGKVTTNDPNSGIYIGDALITASDDNNKKATFNPTGNFYIPKDLIITTTNLEEGTSVIYSITRSVNGIKDSNFGTMKIVVTGDDPRATIASLDIVNSDNVPYLYTVSENTSDKWNWRYTLTPLNSVKDIDLDVQNEFKFEASLKENIVNGVENYNNNIFKSVSTKK